MAKDKQLIKASANSPWGYIRQGLLLEGFLCLRFGGHISGGLIFGGGGGGGGGSLSEFSGILFVICLTCYLTFHSFQCPFNLDCSGLYHFCESPPIELPPLSLCKRVSPPLCQILISVVEIHRFKSI